MIKIAHARLNEVGQTMYGKPGDQTGEEVVIQNLPNKDNGYWEYVLRLKDRKLAKKVAEDAVAIAQNDNIGYDQPDRYSMYNEAKKLKWDFKSISNKCQTDCSQKVTTILIANGIKLSPYIWTITMIDEYMATGKFELVTYSPKMTFFVGDILLTVTKRHTAIVVDTGETDEMISNVPMYVAEVYGVEKKTVYSEHSTKAKALKEWPALGAGNLVDVCDEYIDNGVHWCYVRIAGKYYGWVEKTYLLRKTPVQTATASTDVYFRTNPGAEFKALDVIKQGEKVEICDQKPTKSGTPWYYILRKGVYGFSTTKYFKNIKSK